MVEQFWFIKPTDLIEKEHLGLFFPNGKMSHGQKLNSIVRLTWYFAFIMFLIALDPRYLMIPLLCMTVTVAIYYASQYQHVHSKNETFDNILKTRCTKPTYENPCMNILVNEYVDNPKRPMACDTTNTKVKNKISEIFEARLFRDVDDAYSDFMDRQFYTMPNTSIPNNQADFAKWLYGNPVEKMCKEGNMMACSDHMEVTERARLTGLHQL